MTISPEQVAIYHITDVGNLPSILAEGRLLSDATMALKNPNVVIGYDHIKKRRLKEIQIPCCGYRYVGEFVPFYFCPRSPMLFTINKGNTGHPAGCQKSILHLVSVLAHGTGSGRAWAISDGNAGAFHTSFYPTTDALDSLDWAAIRATDWRGKTHQKSAEFMVADFFPWACIQRIGCHNAAVASEVEKLLANQSVRPVVEVRTNWYY